MSKFEVRHNTGYGLIHQAIMRNEKLTISSKAIYAYLAAFAGTSGKSYPSIKLILREMNISKDTFYKYMKELEQNGIVYIAKERDKGKFCRNIYYLNSNPSEPCPKSSDTVSSDTVSSDTVISDTKSNSIKSNSIKSNSINNISDYENFFNECWEMYPYKRGKGKITTSKKRNAYKLGEEFKRCIKRYSDDVINRRRNFPDLKFQYGSTFWNTGYVDYLDKNYKEGGNEEVSSKRGHDKGNKSDNFTEEDAKKAGVMSF